MSEWWDEDEEVLGTMLGMLAAWDGEAPDAGSSSPISRPPSPAPSSPDSTTTSTTETSSTSTQRRRHNVSRERRKQELQFLRNKVDDMQRQLGELRARRDALLEPHFRDAQQRQLASVVPVWENLATRQYRARRKSELRNRELKLTLQAQMRVAEDLMRIIRHAEQRASNQTLTASMSLGVPIDVRQRMSEEDQLRRLDELCTTWTSEFARCDKFARGDGADSRALWFLDTHVVDDSADEMVIELCSSSVLPYPVARVEEVTWKIFLGERGLSEAGEAFTQTTTATDDLIIAVFSATATLDSGLRGAIQGKSVTRRLRPSATQAILVSHLQSEPQGFAGQLNGVLVYEDVWLRLIDAAELGHTQLGGSVTIVQHVRRSRISVRADDATAEATRSRVEMATHFVTKQIHEEINWAQQAVENLLVVSASGAATGESV